MRNIMYVIAAWMLASILMNGCARKPASDNRVLAEIGNKVITVGDLEYRISKVPSYYKNLVERNKKRFLDETIVEMLFYEEAVRNGLDRDREVKEIINEAKKKILVAKLIKNEVEDKIKVNEYEIRRFYEIHKEEFKTPELWRASHILVATEGEAKEIQDALSKGASFEELARNKSIDATNTRGGDVGYFRMGQLVPEFEKACVKLNVGQTSDIVHTQFGYHIIKLTDKKEHSFEGYEKVKRTIEEELKKRQRSELFDKLVQDLKEKYRVKIKEDVFKSLESMEDSAKTNAK